jgi:hypothetical protein
MKEEEDKSDRQQMTRDCMTKDVAIRLEISYVYR